MFRLKHRVGDSRLAPVGGRSLVLPTVLRSDFLPFTEANRLRRCDLSAKGRLPPKFRNNQQNFIVPSVQIVPNVPKVFHVGTLETKLISVGGFL
ncbi:MAG: hypothetical protein LBG58_17015 [Planctomycetaceae bacterium]|jgi:hypothetical protein|nr:hypothetical protein [Planctomycetaceae bacterium]